MKPRRVKISSRNDAGQYTADDRIEERLAQVRAESQSRTWTQRALLAVAVALVATYVLTAIALDLFLDPDRVRAWVEPRASSALNRAVSVGDARVDLVPRPSLRLADVSIQNPAGFQGPTLAELDEVRLDVSWLQLAIGRLVVRRVHLEGPRVHLAIAENGTSNFGDLVPRRAARSATEAAAPMRAVIRNVTMSGGSLSYFDASRDRSFMVTDGSGRAELDMLADGTWKADVALDSDSLHVRMPSVSAEIRRAEGPTLRLTVRSETNGDIALEDGLVALAEDTLHMNGRIAGLDGARPSYDVLLTNDHMSASALEGLFSADQRARLVPLAEGTLSVAVEVQGGLSAADRPVTHGTAQLEDVTLRLQGDVVAEGIDGVIDFDSARIEIQSLTGRFADGPFDLRGAVTRDDQLSTTLLATARTNLDALDRLGLLPEGLTLSGSGLIDATLTGSLHALDSLTAVGTVTLDGAHLEHRRLAAPIYVPAGVVTVDGRTVRWTDLSVLVGTDALTVSGEVREVTPRRADGTARPDVHLNVTGSHLDLDLLLPQTADGPHVSYPQLAFAHLGARATTGAEAGAGLTRPQGAPVTGTIALAVDTLTYRGYRLERVATTLTLTDSTLSMPEATFATWGGEGSVSVALGFGAATGQPFELGLNLGGVSAESFFTTLTPVGEGISGTLDIEFAARGVTDPSLLPVPDSLSGSARISISDGRLTGTGVNAALSDFLEAPQWSDLAFASWTTDLQIRDRIMDLRESDLSGEQGRIVFDGVLGFGGETDVSVALSLPADQLTLVSLRRTGIGPGVLQQLRTAGQALDLGLHMSGPLAAPTLEPDATRAVALAGR
jgi:hypothetical protein